MNTVSTRLILGILLLIGAAVLFVRASDHAPVRAASDAATPCPTDPPSTPTEIPTNGTPTPTDTGTGGGDHVGATPTPTPTPSGVGGPGGGGNQPAVDPPSVGGPGSGHSNGPSFPCFGRDIGTATVTTTDSSRVCKTCRPVVIGFGCPTYEDPCVGFDGGSDCVY
jgi:hypothetical protein